MTDHPFDKGSQRPTTRARELRHNLTDAERHLWSCLRARQVADTRFNCQFPIGPYIGDFVSRAAKLVVEVDGGQHGVATDADAIRTAFLKRKGYRVIRFWNHDVLSNTDGVIAVIEQALVDSPSPGPSRRREGRLARQNGGTA